MVLDEAGHVVLFNRAAEALTGCESGTVMARRPWDVWTTSEGAAPCEPIITELIRHGGTARCTLRGHAKAGDQRAVDWTFTVPAASDRGTAHIVGTGQPADDALGKRPALVDLARAVHEARTPLTAIIGFAEILAREKHGSIGHPKYADSAKAIEEGGRYLLDIVNEILDFSGARAGLLKLSEEAVDVEATLASCVRLMADQAERGGIVLALESMPDLPAFRGDPGKLKQIALNLVSNALKFTPAGGHVGVAAALDDAGCLTLSVSDTGVGIAATDLPQVLAPFAQVGEPLRGEGRGVGLGLPVVQALVELHGGTFTLDSNEHEGTTARVRFPAERTIT